MTLDVSQTRVDREKPRNFEFRLWFIMDFELLLWTEDNSGFYQLEHSLSQRLLKHLFDNILVENVGLLEMALVSFSQYRVIFIFSVVL